MVDFEPVNGHSQREADAAVGYLPGMLSLGTDLKAAAQFNLNYHFGGWQRFDGFKFDADALALTYHGDSDEVAVARAVVGDETVLVFRHAWVAIIQSDGTFEVARLD